MHGPVIKSVYERFNNQQINLAINIAAIDRDFIDFPEETALLLNDIDIVYGEHSASYLEELTNSEDPWKDARGNLPNYAFCDTPISLEMMKRYYLKKLTGVGVQKQIRIKFDIIISF